MLQPLSCSDQLLPSHSLSYTVTYGGRPHLTEVVKKKRKSIRAEFRTVTLLVHIDMCMWVYRGVCGKYMHTHTHTHTMHAECCIL